MSESIKQVHDFEPYLKALLEGSKFQGTRIVKALYESDTPIEQLYEQVIKQALYRVGELWEQNHISVASEHMATAITEAVLNEIYSRLPLAVDNGKSVVVTCVEGEQHQVGAKMVSDIFEMKGWDSYFLGGNTPVDDIITFSNTFKPDLLAVSFSIYYNLSSLCKLLDAVTVAFPSLAIMVGGQGFIHGGIDVLERYRNTQYIPDLYALNVVL